MKKQIRKYTTIITTTWQSAFEYRMRMFVWFVVEIFPIISTIFLWLGVYNYGQQLEGFSLKSLITYYILSYLIATNISAHFEEDAVEDINAGRVSQYFTRPISYKRTLILGEIGWKMIAFLIVNLPLILAILYFGKNWFLLPKISNLLLMLPFIGLGFIMDSILSLFVVIGAFYFEQAKSLSHLKWMSIEMLSGAILPLSVYPLSFQKVADFLPFRFLRFIPIEIYLDKIDYRTIPSLIVQEILWILILFAAMKLLWKKAEKKYTAVGN
ncbi:ABC transporter permease [Patescibacteria group bacterium]